MSSKIWIIGAGQMAQDYIKVIKDLEQEFIVITRSKESAKNCEEKEECKVISGGLTKFISTNPIIPSHVIIAVGIENLFETTKELITYGVKNILVEKPGALEKDELIELRTLSSSKNVNILIAYNRRFYQSVIKANEILQNDGGISSFNFEFTEWSHKIEPLQKADGVKEKWFLCNSTHVVDLAYYLGGKPKELTSFTSGSLTWHPSSSNFSGAGISERGALFNYHANWESAGRWSIELLTKNNKLILCPLEKLQIQKRGTILIEDYNIDYTIDEKYKPGLFLQTKKFLNSDFTNMCTINEQLNMIALYNEIANYS